MAVEIDRVLETAVIQNATETLLKAGLPPIFRINNVDREAQTAPVTTNEIEDILSVKGAEVRQQYELSGHATFTLSYGENYAVFHVTITRTKDQVTALLRLTKRPA